MSIDIPVGIAELDAPTRARLAASIIEVLRRDGDLFVPEVQEALRPGVLGYFRELGVLELECVIPWSDGAMGHYESGTEHLQESTLAAMGKAIAKNSHAESGDIANVRWTFSLDTKERQEVEDAFSGACALDRKIEDANKRLGAAQVALKQKRAAVTHAENELNRLRGELNADAIHARSVTIIDLTTAVMGQEQVVATLNEEVETLRRSR